MLEHQTSTEENAQILLARAAEWRNNSQQVDLNAESLRQLTESKGIDFATALLFDQIVSSSTHGPFIRQMEQLKQQNSKDTPKLNATVAVVPGAFYREHPETGADGQVMRDEAARHGCQAELIPTKSIGTPAENGRIICDWLANQCDSKIILASLSKGGADVKMALKEPDAPKAFQNVVAWLNVGGVLDGSPMAEWLLSRKLLTQLYRTIFWLRGQDFHFVRELDRRPGCSLDFKLQVPELMRIIHVVGFPTSTASEQPQNAPLASAACSAGPQRLGCDFVRPLQTAWIDVSSVGRRPLPEVALESTESYHGAIAVLGRRTRFVPAGRSG